MESRSSYLFETVSFEHVKIFGTILKKLQIPKLDIIKVFEIRILISENRYRKFKLSNY